MSARNRLAAAALGVSAATIAYRGLRRRPPGGQPRWSRTNHRGEQVSLLEGPALVLATGTAVAASPGLPARLRTAGTLAALGAGALGTYDDLAGSGSSRGFRGHLAALTRGEVTTGAVKILGIGAVGLAAGALVQRRPLDRLLAAAVIAGSANIVNLLDLRPGRALKAALLAGAPGVLRSGPAGVLGAAPLAAGAALLPDDLGERSMLGDSGANALGAVLGVAAAARAGRRGLLARAAILTALTAASEKISFTEVIAATPPLHALDMLGRRAPGAPPAARVPTQPTGAHDAAHDSTAATR